ncbi:hypothetical protein HT094_22380 [Shewanella sp. ZOR0012]|uniref:hypothetical protein n=1 Tax=Shewanella sp. ZOR0012 TaxID=1339231 RepID=UPI000B1917ED|nr:hypothetical protein [Shewanella sp. ZOR0012]NSM26850.1 hypothetical protein [Shewanella sp. ZOR0012]
MEMSNIAFFKKAHRPIYYKATLNKMRNGDTLSLGAIVLKLPASEDGLTESFNAYAQAYITKETKGVFSFTGLWTLPTKATRADTWAMGRFTIQKGVITFIDTPPETLRAFFLVCRYIQRLINLEFESVKENYTDTWFYKNKIPLYFNGFHFDKENTGILSYSSLHSQTNEHIKVKPKLSDDSFKNVCIHPLAALFEKASALGVIEL